MPRTAAVVGVLSVGASAFKSPMSTDYLIPNLTLERTTRVGGVQYMHIHNIAASSTQIMIVIDLISVSFRTVESNQQYGIYRIRRTHHGGG